LTRPPQFTASNYVRPSKLSPEEYAATVERVIKPPKSD
jgi:hypothetical protein